MRVLLQPDSRAAATMRTEHACCISFCWFLKLAEVHTLALLAGCSPATRPLRELYVLELFSLFLCTAALLAEGRGVRSTPFGSAARRSRMEQGFDAPADAPIAAPVAASAPPPSNTRSQKRIMELAARLDLGLDNPDLMQRILTEARKREENVAAARKQAEQNASRDKPADSPLRARRKSNAQDAVTAAQLKELKLGQEQSRPEAPPPTSPPPTSPPPKSAPPTAPSPAVHSPVE